MRSRAAFLLLSILTMSCHTCDDATTARPNDATVSSDSSATATIVNGEIESHRVRAKVPAIAWAFVTRRHEESGAVGLADIEARTLATRETPFEAASIAKLIIATSVMELVEQGRLSLDADVSTYVGFRVRHPRAAEQPITLRHLLSHTSAIADRADVVTTDNRIALDAFLRSYFDGGASSFLDAGPGTTMSYSNVGPSLAALAVERVTKTPFSEHARTRIFVPLGMTSTSFGHSVTTAAAAPYSHRASGFMRLGLPSHALYPVVDLFSSARDLARFARAMLNDGALDNVRILRESSVDEMVRAGFDAAPHEGLGWQLRTFEEGARSVVGHEGEDLGASTGLYLDRVAGTGVVILANGDAFQSQDDERAKALSDLIEKLLRSPHAD